MNKVGILKVLITSVLKRNPRVSHVLVMFMSSKNLNGSLGKGHNHVYYTKYCTWCHQICLSCSILVVNCPCSATNTKCESNIYLSFLVRKVGHYRFKKLQILTITK